MSFNDNDDDDYSGDLLNPPASGYDLNVPEEAKLYADALANIQNQINRQHPAGVSSSSSSSSSAAPSSSSSSSGLFRGSAKIEPPANSGDIKINFGGDDTLNSRYFYTDRHRYYKIPRGDVKSFNFKNVNAVNYTQSAARAATRKAIKAQQARAVRVAKRGRMGGALEMDDLPDLAAAYKQMKDSPEDLKAAYEDLVSKGLKRKQVAPAHCRGLKKIMEYRNQMRKQLGLKGVRKQWKQQCTSRRPAGPMGLYWSYLYSLGPAAEDNLRSIFRYGGTINGQNAPSYSNWYQVNIKGRNMAQNHIHNV